MTDSNRDGWMQDEHGDWWYVVTARRNFTRGYETAAWRDIIEVAPGRWPVVLRDPSGRETDSIEDAWEMTARLDGVMTYEHKPTLLFGSAINDGGSGPRNEPTTHVVRDYAFKVRAVAA